MALGLKIIRTKKDEVRRDSELERLHLLEEEGRRWSESLGLGPLEKCDAFLNKVKEMRRRFFSKIEVERTAETAAHAIHEQKGNSTKTQANYNSQNFLDLL